MPRPKRRSSSIWLHFKDLGNKAKCTYCDRLTSIMNGSTGNLRRHLKLKHPGVIEKVINKNYALPDQSNYAEIIAENRNAADLVHTTLELQCSSSESTRPNNNLEESDQQPVAFYLIESFDEQKGKKIDKQLFRIIIKDFYSFGLVEEQEFTKFVNMLNPSYTLPSRKYLSNDLLSEMYQSSMEELKSNLTDVTSVVLTIDRWTSIKGENYISVTAHYLSKNLQLQTHMLECVSLHPKNDHESMNISLVLKELIVNWELSNKILVVVTDGSDNIVRAVKNCDLNHVYCFAHLLNAVVVAGLEEIKTFLEKVRTIIEYFKTNSLALSKFLMIQRQMGLMYSKLKNDIPDKWNTTFDMLTKFEKNKKPLLAAIEQLHLDYFVLSSSDFEFLDYVIKLLIIFNSIQVELSSEKTVPLSKVPHMIRFIHKHLTSILEKKDTPPQIESMGKRLKEELKKFEVLEKNEIVCQSVLLDPRFKNRGIPTDLFLEAYSSLRRNVISVREEIVKEKSNEISSQPEPVEQVIESEYFIDMWSDFKSEEPPHQQNLAAAANVEIDAFLSDEYLPMESNPLTYWADISNQNKFPALFELAKRLLCVPATSISCERMYSKRGSVLAARKDYTSKNLKQILFLHHNL